MKKGEHLFPPLSVALLCVRIYPVTWVSLEKHKGRDNRDVLRQSTALGWFRPSQRLWHTDAFSKSQNSCWNWNVLCMQVSLEVPFPALLLSCMAVIYFVIIALKFLVCSFLITTLLYPFPILTLTISFFLLPFLCLSTFV